MKRTLLILAATVGSLGMTAATSAAPEVAWGKLIDGPTSAGDQATSIAIDNNNDVYWFGTYGSTLSQPDVLYDGQFLYKGAPYDAGNSQSNNFTLLKTDSEGRKLWCVYTDSGDFASGAGFCAPLSDGGVIAVSKVRHTAGMTDKNIRFVNSDGTPFEIDWKSDRNYYRLAVTKISSDGVIEWNRMVDFSTTPGPAASGVYADFWAEGFNLGGGTVDNNGNIYIALNYRTEMSLQTASGATQTFKPNNTASWTGDPQTATGDFMLLSLDKDGYYRSNLRLEGDCEVSYCQNIEWADGKLYAQGYITGKAGSAMKVGGINLYPSTVMSPVVLAADADLNVTWAKCFKGEEVAGKKALQNMNLTLINGSLYICGQYNLKFSDPDDPSKFVASTQGSIREGFVLKLNPDSGEWMAARDSRDDDWNKPSAVAKTGLTGYIKVIPSPTNANSVYVFGYVMNAQVGVFLREYDATTLEGILPEGEFNIVTNGGVPTCQAAALDKTSGSLYINCRGNKAFTLYNGTDTAAPMSWGILAAKYELGKPVSTELISITPDASDAPVEYFTLDGLRVKEPVKGLYIRRQGAKVEKVLF